MSSYGQYCPVAKAMELLDERWTMLVVRELLVGSQHFNDLRRGVPKMSPALLSKLLQTLTRAGVVAIPTAVFSTRKDELVAYLRFAFCKRPAVIDRAAAQLAALES